MQGLPTTQLQAVSLILLSQSAHNTPTRYINHLAFIVLFTLVCQQGADDFTGVLNHHLAVVDVALAEQPSPMNPGSETHTCNERQVSFYCGWCKILYFTVMLLVSMKPLDWLPLLSPLL